MGGGSSPPSHPCPLFSFLLFKAVLKCLGRTGSLLTETSELLKVTEMVASRWHQHGGQNWVFTLLALHCAECYDWPLEFVFDSVGYAHSMIIMESKISLTVNYDTKVSKVYLLYLCSYEPLRLLPAVLFLISWLLFVVHSFCHSDKDGNNATCP